MAASVHGVRDRVDGILAHLDRTDQEARAAAQAVGDQFRLHGAGEAPHDQDGGDMPGEQTLTGSGPTEGGEGAGEEDHTGPPAAAPSVDELFARIRAGSESGAPAHEATADDTVAATVVEIPVAGGDDGGAAEPSGEAEAEPTEAEAEPTEADAPPGPDDALIARRDELLAPVLARLSRSVKRALGDDQNRLLDQLRSASSQSIDELLGSEEEHLTAFATAASGHLGEAFTAGVAFAGRGAPAATESDAVEQSVAGLAHVIVTMLRRQMEDGTGELADRVGAAFREWRGERVERLAGDYATQAFSAGVTESVADGKVRWVVTSADGCSDCEDNALAGAVSAAETFPTGHEHPPAHSGCRCLVAPADD